VATRGTLVLATALFSSLICASAATAQVSSADQRCIAAFNQGVRKVTKAQSKIVKKCLTDFASGRLSSATPEDCVRSDPKQRLDSAVVKAAAKTALLCTGSTPAFGTSPVENAYARASLSQIELAHETIGRDLNTDLIGNTVGASCQAQVTGALLKCADRRLREYLKCQKDALRHGVATDAASLSDACLGIGAAGQPDPVGHIQADCDAKVGGAILSRCTGVDLGDAFSSCFATNPNDATDCLKRESACQLCLMVNDVDQLSRDCDLLDDGNAANGSCGSECPDGIVQQDESCDDGNATDNDGCSDHCTIEGGWACTGEPSTCTRKCGDGALDAGESCDDANLTNGDGCNNACDVENGYECSGAPSVCQKKCGNGTVDVTNGEVCDDDNNANGDGCSSTCQVEDGFNCAGTAPSVCTFVCGNGTFQTGETCDDNNAANNDGCSHTCKIEPGWLCAGIPSVCAPQCGDGLKRGTEACDDHNLLSGDGCSFLCQVEAGFTCSGTPSHCIAVCGDGFIRGFETCDDSNNISGDGCSATFCRQEAQHTCLGQPSLCFADCGDGNLDSGEDCDDGNLGNGDGCHNNCTIEAGYSCGGQPSVCGPTCGNGMLDASEQCDDGNTTSRDGCSSGCRNESGWLCPTPGAPCNQYEIVIDTPLNGVFTNAATQVITGHYTLLPPLQVGITVNGLPAIVNTRSQLIRLDTFWSPTGSHKPENVFARLAGGHDGLSHDDIAGKFEEQFRPVPLRPPGRAAKPLHGYSCG